LPTKRNTSQYYIDFLPQLTEGAVDLLDNEQLVSQFASLERSPRRSSHDAVNHPPNTHDDVACAVAAACVQAMARYDVPYEWHRPPMWAEGVSGVQAI
jgi:hypothetical protein